MGKFQSIPDEAQQFTQKDWDLHSEMTYLSENPVFGLILNGFKELYQTVGPFYFSSDHSRERSRRFYQDLLILAERRDLAGFETATLKIMEESIAIWMSAKS